MQRSWLLGAHIAGVTLWMGGLLAFSRILAYRAKQPPSAQPRLSRTAERINRFVAIPGATIALGCGVGLIADHGASWFRAATWLHWKLPIVVALIAIHVLLIALNGVVRSAPPDRTPSRATFMVLHRVAGVFVVAIVLLATLRPMLAP
jgi:putative membrane protein